MTLRKLIRDASIPVFPSELELILLNYHKIQANFGVDPQKIERISSSKFLILTDYSKSTWYLLALKCKGFIANAKKYLQSGWLRGVQYWSYLYSVFNICSL